MQEKIINIEWCPLVRQFIGDLMSDGNTVIIQKEVFLENIQKGYLKRQQDMKNTFFLEDENRYWDTDDLYKEEDLLFDGDLPWIKESIWTREEFEKVRNVLRDIPFVAY